MQLIILIFLSITLIGIELKLCIDLMKSIKKGLIFYIIILGTAIFLVLIIFSFLNCFEM